MIKQKKNYVPTINGVPMGTLNAANNFTTDFIEFPESTPWSVQFDAWAGVVEGTPTATILCSNTQDGDYINYNPSSTQIDLTVDEKRLIFDSAFAPRFMKIQYKSGASTGTFKLTVSK